MILPSKTSKQTAATSPAQGHVAVLFRTIRLRGFPMPPTNLTTTSPHKKGRSQVKKQSSGQSARALLESSKRSANIVCLLFSTKLSHPLVLKDYDIKQLEDGRWLQESMVEFLMHYSALNYLEAQRTKTDELYVVSPYHWTKFVQSKFTVFEPETDPALGANLTSYRYIHIGINVGDNHWILAVIGHLGPTLTDTAIIILDSLMRQYPSVVFRLKKFILFVRSLDTSLTFVEKEVESIPVYYPEVIVQPDVNSCGFYPAHFMAMFMTDPDAYFSHCTGKCMIQETIDEVWGAAYMSDPRSVALTSILHLARWMRRADAVRIGGPLPKHLL